MPYAPERRTVEAFEKAVREHAWIGAQHPDVHRDIERHYHQKKAKLLELLGFDYVMPTDDKDDD